MSKNKIHNFEAVENGNLAARNLATLETYKKAIDELALTMSHADLVKTGVYQMYQFTMNETTDYLIYE